MVFAFIRFFKQTKKPSHLGGSIIKFSGIQLACYLQLVWLGGWVRSAKKESEKNENLYTWESFNPHCNFLYHHSLIKQLKKIILGAETMLRLFLILTLIAMDSCLKPADRSHEKNWVNVLCIDPSFHMTLSVCHIVQRYGNRQDFYANNTIGNSNGSLTDDVHMNKNESIFIDFKHP